MVSAFNYHFSEKTSLLKACIKNSGIGKKMAIQLLDRVGISPSLQIGKVSSSQLSKIKELVDRSYVVESTLRNLTKQNILKLSSISSYRGWRHSNGLPCRGQRTHTNARTCRRLKK